MADYQTTTTTSIPEWLQPYMQSYVQQGAQLASQPQPQWMGQQVAPLNQNYTLANDLIRQTAMNSSPDVLAGRGAITNIAGGQPLNNPWLSPQLTQQNIQFNAQQMADAAARGTMAQTDALYALQGAYGGSAYNEQQAQNQAELARQVGGMANQYQLANQQLGANSWQQGVGQMLGAAGMAPQMQQMDLQAAQALAGAGDIQRGYQQQLMDQGYNTWAAQQRYPYEQANFMGGVLGLNSGGTSTTSGNSGSPSPWAIGGGLGLLGLGLLGGG